VRGVSTDGTQNIALLAEQSFERKGDYESLCFEGRWYGSGELFERSQRLAAGLAELDVGPGERVVVTMANCPEVGIAYHALWRAGAVVTPATFLLSTEELRHVIANSEASAVIASGDLLDKVAEAAQGVDSVRYVITNGEAGDALRERSNGRIAQLSLAQLEQSEPRPIVTRSDHDLAALLYTGGTTGRSKGVMLSHANLYFAGKAGQEAAYVPGVNRGLATLPLSHSYGLLTTIAAMHSPERGVAVLLRWFDATKFLELIGEHRLQQSAVVPSMLQILLSKPIEDYDLSSLRYLTCGAAPLAREVADEFRRRVPSASIRQGYGLTETAALVATNPAGREKPGSVGLPVPGSDVRIVDDEGAELPPGEVGEICSRSPGVMLGYWRSPETTAESLHDGWLLTGDMGYLDEEGYLFIVDRKKDLIIRGGFNVYPRDVEDALLEHPAVEMAGVVGKPDAVHGEEVVAFVSLRDDASLSPEELIAWSREHIGGYKYPRDLRIIDSVPLTTVGKVDRKALRTSVLDRATDAQGK
jgi:long-chain acyl-CoA synthetase